jgi:tetratricopeptide (TPR) repeat protein
LGGIILLGAVLRGLFLREIVEAPDFAYPVINAGYHNYWARGLATGNWVPPEGFPDPGIQTTPYFRPPGYPYFLALIYWIGSKGYLLPRIVQMGLGLVNCLLAFALGRRWFGHAVGLVVAVLMASYWIFIYFEGEFHAPVLLILLLLSFIYVLGLWTEKIRLRYSLVAGLLLGLSALVRPNLLLFVPVVVGWMFWVVRKRRVPQRVYASGAGFVVVVLVAIAPVTIRNYLVAHDVVLISSNGGINFFIGNNEIADGFYDGTIPWLDNFEFGTCYDYPEIVNRLEHKQGKPLKHSQVSAYFSKKAMRYIREHPLQAIGLMVKKALLFWGPREITNNKVIHYERQHSATLRHLPGFPFAVSLFVLGLVLLLIDLWAKKGSEGSPIGAVWSSIVISPVPIEMVVLIFLFVITYFASVLPFFAAARFRVPVIPFLLLFGAYGLCRVVRLMLDRQVRRAVCCAAAFGGLYTLANTPFVPYEPDLAMWHYHRGVAYARRENLDQAISEYRTTLQIKPHYAKGHYNLGYLLKKKGEPAGAIKHYTEAVRLNPDYVDAHVNIGLVLQEQGKTDDAIRHYKWALRIYPEHIKARNNLGNALQGMKRYAEAIEHYKKALEIEPTYAIAHKNLGIALTRQGRIDEAIRHYREALRIHPDFTSAHYSLGLARMSQGRIDEAIAEYRETLRLNPNHSRAQQALDYAVAKRGQSVKP